MNLSVPSYSRNISSCPSVHCIAYSTQSCSWGAMMPSAFQLYYPLPPLSVCPQEVPFSNPSKPDGVAWVPFLRPMPLICRSLIQQPPSWLIFFAPKITTIFARVYVLRPSMHAICYHSMLYIDPMNFFKLLVLCTFYWKCSFIPYYEAIFYNKIFRPNCYLHDLSIQLCQLYIYVYFFWEIWIHVFECSRN